MPSPDRRLDRFWWLTLVLTTLSATFVTGCINNAGDLGIEDRREIPGSKPIRSCIEDDKSLKTYESDIPDDQTFEGLQDIRTQRAEGGLPRHDLLYVLFRSTSIKRSDLTKEQVKLSKEWLGAWPHETTEDLAFVPQAVVRVFDDSKRAKEFVAHGRRDLRIPEVSVAIEVPSVEGYNRTVEASGKRNARIDLRQDLANYLLDQHYSTYTIAGRITVLATGLTDQQQRSMMKCVRGTDDSQGESIELEDVDAEVIDLAGSDWYAETQRSLADLFGRLDQ